MAKDEVKPECKNTKTYKGINPPRCGCKKCWEIYIEKHKSTKKYIDHSDPDIKTI
jgi:hypothetical protein